MLGFFVFFVKQKTAYEMRISDWRSDVCFSDLAENSKGEGAAPSLVLEREQPVSEQPQAQPHCQGQRCVHLPEVGAAPDEACDGENDEQEIGRASCRERVCQYV